MIIQSAIRLAFAASCLTAILTLPTARAQMGAPGGYGYGPPPGAYGYGPLPGAYGYGSPPAPYGYGPPQGTYPHQAVSSDVRKWTLCDSGSRRANLKPNPFVSASLEPL